MNKAINTVSKYSSLVKFPHSLFALPFAMIGFFMAVTSRPFGLDIWLLVKVLACMVFARNAAMSFNRFTDREFDQLNPRTWLREIPAGIIPAKTALVFSIANALLFMATTFFINLLCFYLSPVALLVILGYSLTKRFTSLSHMVLGLGLSLAPVGAYLSVAGEFDCIPVMLSFSVLCWVAGFDIIYALQDEEFDKSLKLKSVPAWLGKKRALRLSSILHVITVLIIVRIGFADAFGWLFWLGTVIFSLLIFYQHLLVKPNDLSKINLAFFTTNGIASLVFAGFVIADLYWH
ncbi:MAG: putative 4-hydroxybenzoate polyprenyltransferase [Bacteroidetes bacterium]|nr:putative 4-hydroxybenzoate polyprenyltransferase [Bacteroidota bacterium]